jgi:hypothetical protein
MHPIGHGGSRRLWHHPQAIGLVAGLRVGVHAVVGLKAAQFNLDAGQFVAVAQHIKGAAVL